MRGINEPTFLEKKERIRLYLQKGVCFMRRVVRTSDVEGRAIFIDAPRHMAANGAAYLCFQACDAAGFSGVDIVSREGETFFKGWSFWVQNPTDLQIETLVDLLDYLGAWTLFEETARFPN